MTADSEMFVSFSSLLKNFQIKMADQCCFLDQNNESSQISEIPIQERGSVDLILLALVDPLWKYEKVKCNTLKPVSELASTSYFLFTERGTESQKGCELLKNMTDVQS